MIQRNRILIMQGSARMLLHRLQGPMEEETLKAHFEQIVQIGQRHHPRKIQVSCLVLQYRILDTLLVCNCIAQK
jgi:hypothetical protein